MAANTSESPNRPHPAGLVLAAGGGIRYGSPKALVRGADGVPWLQRTVQTLASSGCSPILVVLGAAADQAEALLVDTLHVEVPVVIVRAPEWASGLAASLRAGIEAAQRVAPPPPAIVVVPVDVPDLNRATVARVVSAPESEPAGMTPDSLRQAVFAGRPGHPVLIGRAHWAPLVAQLHGDQGARSYLVAHGVQSVDCGDLSTGLDVDYPQPHAQLTPLPLPTSLPTESRTSRPHSA